MYQQHLVRALTYLTGAFSFLVKGLKEVYLLALANRVWTAVTLSLVVVLVVGTSLLFGSSPDESETDSRKEVTLVRVGDVASAEPLSLIGEIRAVREANVSADSSGAVKGVYRDLGDFVAAGTVIAELDNARQAALVSQAKASLEKARSGAAVGTLTVGTAKSGLEAAISSARNAATNARATMSDAIRRSADNVFSNADSSQPHFVLATSNQQLVFTVESERLALRNVLSRHASVLVPVDYDGLIKELELLSIEVTEAQQFLTNVSLALNNAVSSSAVSEGTISGYRIDVAGANSAVTGVRSAVSGSIELLKAKSSSVLIAEESLSAGSGQSADVSAAEANLASAMATLETTIIRAPISGTINRLDLEIGSFVSPGAPVVFISSTGALEAVVYVSERDIRDIAVGASAQVSGSINGSVVRVARALDPITKKAEVRIAVPQNAELVSGQSATIEITRTKSGTSALIAPSIPLSALKITPDGAVVFSVDENKTLLAIPVTLGQLRGSKIEVESGISLDSVIVSDARGLKAGQQVEISVE